MHESSAQFVLLLVDLLMSAAMWLKALKVCVRWTYAHFSRTQIIEGHWKILVDPARVSLDKSDMTIKTKNAVEIPLSVSPAVLLKVRQT
jgi:hypothetical protein